MGKATLVLRADADCAIYCDGQLITALNNGKIEKVMVDLGSHTIEFVSLENESCRSIKKVICDVPGNSFLVSINDLRQQINQVQNITMKLMTKANGHSFVDLGLSVVWATCNIGAKRDTDFGLYYALGDTTPESDKHFYLPLQFPDSYYKNIDEECSINPESGHDPVRKLWGGKWRLPTKEDVQDLIDNCDQYKEYKGDKEFLKCTSKINSQSIIIPYAGYYNHQGWNCSFWTSTLRLYGSFYIFNDGYIGDNDIASGLQLRAVMDKE